MIQVVFAADISHFRMKPSIRRLCYTRPGFLTAMHPIPLKIYFQGHSMQCVTIVKTKMQLRITAPTPKYTQHRVCGSLWCQWKQSRGLNLSGLNPVSVENSPSVTKSKTTKTTTPWGEDPESVPRDPPPTNHPRSAPGRQRQTACETHANLNSGKDKTSKSDKKEAS